MINYLNQINHPQSNYHKFFEVMRDFRKGGLNPSMYDDFIQTIQELPQRNNRNITDYQIFDKYNLVDITQNEFTIILREVMKRAINDSKECWHPNASPTNCNVDSSGIIIVSAAHSIQNNGVLSKIAENGDIMGHAFNEGKIEGKKSHKNHASIFWGFCNTHDSIFTPIETGHYVKSDIQNFLFAYRSFVVSYHKKKEVSKWMNFGEQSENDLIENKKIFDNAIINENYSVIKTEVFELDKFYPIVVSSAFYLDFDFNGNEIKHSDERMENIYITLLPIENKTFFLLSYFEVDKHLYGDLGKQLTDRNKLKFDITMLVGAHTENIYFNPVYYKTFIEKHEKDLKKLMMMTQFDREIINENGEFDLYSLTPKNYLNNTMNINFFGY